MKLSGKKVVQVVLAVGLFLLGFRSSNIFTEETQDYHWKFIVPVELKNLDPSVKTVLFIVEVYDVMNKVIGSAKAPLKAPPGEYSAFMNIVIKADPGKDPYTAKKYAINLALSQEEYSANIGYVMVNNFSKFSWTKPKPGAEFVGAVTGDIPQQ